MKRQIAVVQINKHAAIGKTVNFRVITVSRATSHHPVFNNCIMNSTSLTI